MLMSVIILISDNQGFTAVPDMSVVNVAGIINIVGNFGAVFVDQVICVFHSPST
jgi:hypothetical protein